MRPQPANESHEAVFGARLGDLRGLLGPAANTLIPLFAEAALSYRQGGSIGEAATRKARTHVAAAKRLERPIDTLLSAVNSATKLLDDAERLGVPS